MAALLLRGPIAPSLRMEMGALRRLLGGMGSAAAAAPMHRTLCTYSNPLPRRRASDRQQLPPRPPPPPEPPAHPVKYTLSDSCVLVLWKGDIGLWYIDRQTDAIVAPANKKLNGGLGVDGAIFRYAGPRLLEYTQSLPDTAKWAGQGRGFKCETAEAVVTPSFDCQVSRIIHAVGPVWERGREEEARNELVETYLTVLNLARKEGCKFLCFPDISCENYGYPQGEGSERSLSTVRKNCQDFQEIHFVFKWQETYDVWIDTARRMWSRGA